MHHNNFEPKTKGLKACYDQKKALGELKREDNVQIQYRVHDFIIIL